jgi:LysM repeat protein
MNNPNPFVPKGSLLEQQSKRRSRLKLAVFCVLAFGVAGLAAMLIQGCKREQPSDVGEPPTIDTNTVAVTDTNASPVDTNAMAVAPPAMTNAMVTPSPETAGTEYTVVKGDTLATIAKKHGVTLKAMEAANPSVVPTKLKIGQKLTLPAPVNATTEVNVPSAGGEAYTIKSGDTLTKIAHSHGTTVKAIEAANSGLDPNHIKVGQKLTIPSKAEAATPAAPALVPEPVTTTPPSGAPMTPPSTTPAK